MQFWNFMEFHEINSAFYGISWNKLFILWNSNGMEFQWNGVGITYPDEK